MITSAPPPPSMVSLPEPVLIVFAADDAVTVSADRHDRRVEVLEIRDADAVAGRLVGAGGHREIDGGDSAGRGRTSVSLPEPPSIELSVPR